jgi:predicted ATPase/class 3 adenylate cyclase
VAAARDTTFCFTDIAGSTGILRGLGEARYDELLERHRALIRAALAAAGGTEIKTEGDGFFVTFHDAAASLRFAVEAQRALGAEPWPVPLRVRMGLHRGPGRVRSDGDYSSLAAHQAARVATAAHGGQVLVTADVVRDCDPPEGARLVHLGLHRLRDFDGGVALLQLAGPGLLDGFPPVRATREDHGLPLPRSSLVGRDRELRLLHDLLTTVPMVTLHGPGGVGKTRLALEAAASLAGSFPDGLHFVELSPIVDGSVVVPTVATALRVQPPPGQDPLESVVDLLSSGTRLLVLDSAERVLDPVARLADEVVRRCPDCTVLVTTTEPVRIPDERVVPVPPLPAPDEAAAPDEALESDAVRLLVQRATARGADLGDGAAADVADALGTIARRLDGIPLALELAAGRIAEVGVAETLAGLDHRFALLTNGWRTALPRHRTLQAMVEWTVSSLDDEHRELLRRLAGLRGRWRPSDALAAVGAEDHGTAAVHRLVEQSLLWLDGEPSRLRMYDTVRAYLDEHLPQHDRAARLARKRRWLLLRMQELSPGPDTATQEEVAQLLPDIREAVAVGPDDWPVQEVLDATSLAAMTSPWFEGRGLWDEGILRLEQLLERCPPGEERLTAMTYLAQQYVAMGDTTTAGELARTVVAAPETPDHAKALAYVTLTVPGTAPPEGIDPLEEALRLCEDPESAVALAVRTRIAVRHLANGDAATAAAQFEEIVEAAVRGGRSVIATQSIGNLGGALLRLGRLDEAEATLQRARQMATDAHIPQIAAVCLTNLSLLATHRGDGARALELAEERWRISKEMGDRRGAGAALVAIANGALALGRRDRAREANQQAYDTFRKLDLVEGAATALFNLVVLADGDDDLPAAARAAADLARLVTTAGNAALHSLALYAAAGVGAHAGVEAGAELLGAAEAHRPEVVALDPSDFAWLASRESALVAAIGADAVTAARARGADLSMAAALDLAVDVGHTVPSAGG